MGEFVSQSFNKLMSDLADISAVVTDSSVQSDMQNILFQKKGERVELVGVSPTITHKVICSSDALSYEGEEEEFRFQVSAKQLMNALGAYKSLSMTQVVKVAFSVNERNKVVVKITEADNFLSEGENNLMLRAEQPHNEHESVWHFDSLPIRPGASNMLNMTFPEETITIMGEQLMGYVNEAYPLIQGGQGAYSRLYFASDYVFIMHSAFISYITNQLDQSVFSDITIDTKAVAFLSKVFKSGNGISIDVGKSGQYLCLRTDVCESFIMFTSSLPDHKMYLSVLKDRDNGFEFNRLYLRDVLKRFLIKDESVNVTFSRDDSSMTFSNSAISQVVPLTCVTGFDEFPKFSFSMKPDIFGKAILFDENSKADGLTEVRMYMVDFKGNKILVFADQSGIWNSVVRIKMR